MIFIHSGFDCAELAHLKKVLGLAQFGVVSCRVYENISHRTGASVISYTSELLLHVKLVFVEVVFCLLVPLGYSCVFFTDDVSNRRGGTIWLSKKVSFVQC